MRRTCEFGFAAEPPDERVAADLAFPFPPCREYFAPVGFGVPPQYMNVILDTGCVFASPWSVRDEKNATDEMVFTTPGLQIFG